MNSLCTISGHGFRGNAKIILPPTAITSVAAPTKTDSGIVFTWSGGLSQDGSTVTTTYTLNGSGATPSLSGTGTATFSLLNSQTSYIFVVTATTSSSKTGTITVSTTAPDTTSQPVIYYPFQSDILDYASGSGVNDGTLSNGNIYYQSSVGYKSGVGCLNNSTFDNTNYFNLPLYNFAEIYGCSIAFWFKVSNTQGSIFKAIDTISGVNINIYNYGSSNCVQIFTPTGYYLLSGITYNTWYHMVWVLPSTGLSYLYINGGSVNGGSTIQYSTSHQTVNISPTAMRFFSDYFLAHTYAGSKGYMNNFNLYNRAISQAEITALWQA